MSTPGSTFLVKFAERSAGLGFLFWFALLFVSIGESPETELMQKVVLFGALVGVPLGLSLVATPDRFERHCSFYRWAVLIQPVASITAFLSLVGEQGVFAALLSSPLFILHILIALFGVWRLLPRGPQPLEEFSIDAGLIFLPIAGFWFVIYRLGIQLFNFGETIILLTAVHFQFAGFASPIIAGLTGRFLASQSYPRWVYNCAVIGLLGGIPFVAIGITFNPLIALVGASLITIGLVLLAFLVPIWVVPSINGVSRRVVLAMSALAGLPGMALACVYAFSIFSKTLIIDIPTMARSHGLLNAFGFTTLALIVWTTIRPPMRSSQPGIPFTKLNGIGFVGPEYFDRAGAISSTKTQPRGLVETFSIFKRNDFDTDGVNKIVRAFYEQTADYRLIVRPYWRRPFRIGGKLVRSFGLRTGQLCLPVETESLESRIASRFLPIADELDGRLDVRGWVRTYADTEQAMYVAAYSTHQEQRFTYMNIAFPLSLGVLTSVLHLDSLASPDSTGVVLSSLFSSSPGGDQGVYYSNRWFSIRLPIDERIKVWPVEGGPVLQASHEMWFFGKEFLYLEYDIYQIE